MGYLHPRESLSCSCGPIIHARACNPERSEGSAATLPSSRPRACGPPKSLPSPAQPPTRVPYPFTAVAKGWDTTNASHVLAVICVSQIGEDGKPANQSACMQPEASRPKHHECGFAPKAAPKPPRAEFARNFSAQRQKSPFAVTRHK